MNLNPNVCVDTEVNPYTDRFTPEFGYALWRDNEEANLDENGQPMQYYLQMNVVKAAAEEEATHIFAVEIDDTMEIFGKIPGMEEVTTFGMRDTGDEPSHTYIDENGVERRKRGVF